MKMGNRSNYLIDKKWLNLDNAKDMRGEST